MSPQSGAAARTTLCERRRNGEPGRSGEWREDDARMGAVLSDSVALPRPTSFQPPPSFFGRMLLTYDLHMTEGPALCPSCQRPFQSIDRLTLKRFEYPDGSTDNIFHYTVICDQCGDKFVVTSENLDTVDLFPSMRGPDDPPASFQVGVYDPTREPRPYRAPDEVNRDDNLERGRMTSAFGEGSRWFQCNMPEDGGWHI